MKPVANMKADTISQIVPFEKPSSAWPAFMTPSTGRSAQAMIAMAPSGSGCRMKPAIVATKTASRPHACGPTPAGAGINQMIAPMATQIRPRSKLLLFSFDI